MTSHIFWFLSRSCMRSSVSCWRAFLTKAKPASTGYRPTAASVLPQFVASYAMHSYSECHMNTAQAITFWQCISRWLYRVVTTHNTGINEA